MARMNLTRRLFVGSCLVALLLAAPRANSEPMARRVQALDPGGLVELEANRLIPHAVAKWLRADPEMARMLALDRTVAVIGIFIMTSTNRLRFL